MYCTSTTIYHPVQIPICLPLYLCTLYICSVGCRPSCPQCCCSVARLMVAPPLKGHRATLPLAVHQSLCSDWLASRGLIALLFPLTFPANPEVLTCPTAHTYTHISAWVRSLVDKICIIFMREQTDIWNYGFDFCDLIKLFIFKLIGWYSTSYTKNKDSKGFTTKRNDWRNEKSRDKHPWVVIVFVLEAIIKIHHIFRDPSTIKRGVTP